MVSSKPSTDIFLEEDEQHKAPVECCGCVCRADLSIQELLLGYEGLWAPRARRWQLAQHNVILNKCFFEFKSELGMHTGQAARITHGRRGNDCSIMSSRTGPAPLRPSLDTPISAHAFVVPVPLWRRALI